jgi:hypothetical protein
MENTLKLENTLHHTGQPFSVTFSHKNESIKIALKDNADLFKLAESYKQLLDKLEIKCIVTYENINDQN